MLVVLVVLVVPKKGCVWHDRNDLLTARLLISERFLQLLMAIVGIAVPRPD